MALTKQGIIRILYLYGEKVVLSHFEHKSTIRLRQYRVIIIQLISVITPVFLGFFLFVGNY